MTDLVKDSIIKVGVVAHPSLLQYPADIEMLNKSDVHFLWLNAGEDSMMHNQEKQKETKQITSGNDKHKHVGAFPLLSASLASSRRLTSLCS